MLIRIFILLIFSVVCSAYIYTLNGSEYHRMPRLFHLDPYEPCLYANNGTGVYCSVKFDLVTDQPNEIYDLIREYSAKTEVHFNHSKLTYGICLTETCKQFYQRNTTKDLSVALEACLNETFWKKYELKTRITEELSCNTLETTTEFDNSDIAVAIVIAILLLLNVIGSLQELYFGEENDHKGNRYLSCFGFQRNWRKLIAPSGEGPEPRLATFKGFSSIKVGGAVIIIMLHSILPAAVINDNPHTFEEYLTRRQYQIIANVPLMIQSYLIISGFLLAYNLQIHSEKRSINWRTIPIVIFYRWWRLAPVMFIVMAIYMTWGRYLSPGPLWQAMVGNEVEDCRQNWWLHLLFIQNYVDQTECMMHTWYIATDMQLFCVGLLVLCLTDGRRRKILLALWFLAGVLLPAAHTYYQDLDAVVVVSPETARNLVAPNPTFTHTYKRGHTNMAAYIIGLSLGLLVYHWQTTGFKIHNGIMQRLMMVLSFPGMLVLPYSCGVFYDDAPRASIFIRTLGAALLKPLWSVTIVTIILGLVYKFDATISRLMEGPLWPVPARLSYCMCIVHLILIRFVIGTRTALMNFTFLNLMEAVTSIVALSFLVALPLHLLVETPFNQLLKTALSFGEISDSTKKEIMNGTNYKDNTKSNEVQNEVKQNGKLKTSHANGKTYVNGNEQINGMNEKSSDGFVNADSSSLRRRRGI